MNSPEKSSLTNLSRRQAIKAATAMAALAPVSAFGQSQTTNSLPASFDGLKPLGSRARPITAEEFQARVARAQKLLAEQNPKLDALFVAPGKSLYYFTGVHWWPSERLLGLMIPQKGQPLVVCAGFEEARFREQLKIPAEVRVWQEDQSPTALIAAASLERRSSNAVPFTSATAVITALAACGGGVTVKVSVLVWPAVSS